LKPAWANSSQDPILKNPFTKKGAGEMAQSVGPEFKPQYPQKKYISCLKASKPICYGE
jgi:hypothetical protein